MPTAISFALLPRPTARAIGHVVNTSYQVGTDLLPLPIVRTAANASESRRIGGHPVMIFNIPQVVNLTYPSSTFEGAIMNNYPINRTDFRLVRGVTNEILFFVRDIDRKPVTLQAGDVLSIVITDLDAGSLLMQRELSPVDLAKGLYMLTTLPSEMDRWATGPVRWSVSYTPVATNKNLLLWTDQNYSPFSTAQVTEAPIPGPAPTVALTWNLSFALLDGNYYSVPLTGAAKDGFSNGMQTFACFLTGFSGTIRIDGSLVAQPDNTSTSLDWFQVATNTYVNATKTDVVNVQGNFIWMRLVVSLASGSLDQVQYKQ